MEVNTTALRLDDLERHVSSLLPGIKRQYDRGVNRDLSRQQWQDLFKRNITVVLQQAYQDALIQLQQLASERENLSEKKKDGRLEQVLTAFHMLIDELMQYALQKHRSSCALSNFPEEHNPSQAYIAQVLQQVDRDWSAFESQVAALLPG